MLELITTTKEAVTGTNPGNSTQEATTITIRTRAATTAEVTQTQENLMELPLAHTLLVMANKTLAPSASHLVPLHYQMEPFTLANG